MDTIDKVGATVTGFAIAWLITGSIIQAAVAAGMTFALVFVWRRIRKGRR
jgi:uncharacterized protein (DUF697 family)